MAYTRTMVLFITNSSGYSQLLCLICILFLLRLFVSAFGASGSVHVADWRRWATFDSNGDALSEVGRFLLSFLIWLIFIRVHFGLGLRTTHSTDHVNAFKFFCLLMRSSQLSSSLSPLRSDVQIAVFRASFIVYSNFVVFIIIGILIYSNQIWRDRNSSVDRRLGVPRPKGRPTAKNVRRRRHS